MRRAVLGAVATLSLWGLAGAAGPPTEGPAGALQIPPGSVAPEPASGAPVGCTVTGRLLPPEALERDLAVDELRQDAGVVLDRAERWLVPAGQRPVLVVEGSDRLGPTRMQTVVAGRVLDDRPLRPVEGYRVVAEVKPIDPALRTVGIKIDATICEIALAVTVDRGSWSTVTGATGLMFTALLSVAVVLVAVPPAHRPGPAPGGLRRRFLLAAPLGAAWGLAQLPLWYEGGLLSPFRNPPLWPTLVGLVLALFLVVLPAFPVRPGAGRVRLRPARPSVVIIVAGVLGVVLLAVGAAVAVTAPSVTRTAGSAAAPVVTPERAEVLLVRALTEDREFGAGATVSAAVVGVPAGQETYPAWFVGTATLRRDGAETRLWVRFERGSAARPWRLVAAHRTDQELEPMRDGAGWLAPPPAADELPLSPAGLPQRYLDRVIRAAETGRVDVGGGLALHEPAASLPALAAARTLAELPGPVTVAYEPVGGEVVGEPVRLVDGSVLVWFTAAVRQVAANESADCGGQGLFWSDEDPPGRFRELSHVIEVTARAQLMMDSAEVVIDDRERRSGQRSGIPC